MRIPRGSTGFYEPPETLPQIDTKHFRSLVYDASRAFGVEVVEIGSRVTTSKSFFEATLAAEDSHFRVLQNCIHGQLGFAHPSRTEQIVFMDASDIAGRLSRDFQYDILSRTELESRLGDHDLSDLSSAEHGQIRYWKPTRLGDLIFNHWD